MLTEMLKMFQIAMAAVGYLVFMGVVALCFEPHFRTSRESIMRSWRNRGAWRTVGKKTDYGVLPGRERNRVRR